MCSSRVSFGCLMSLSQPGSPRKKSFLITVLICPTPSGVTCCMQSAHHVRDQWIRCLSRRAETTPIFQVASKCQSVRFPPCGPLVSVLCCVLPRYQMDPIFCLKSFRLRLLMPTLNAPCVDADAEFCRANNGFTQVFENRSHQYKKTVVL